MSDAPQTTPKTMIERQIDPVADRGTKGFLKWLKLTMPSQYNYLLPQLRKQALQYQAVGGLGAFGDAAGVLDVSNLLQFDSPVYATPAGTAAANAATAAPTSSFLDTIKNSLAAFSQAYLTKQQIDAQKKITDIQLQRAQQGLSPLAINPADYGLTPTVSVGLASPTMKALMWGGGALAAVYLLKSFMHAPRRSFR